MIYNRLDSLLYEMDNYNICQGVDSNKVEELILIAYKEDITNGATIKQLVNWNWNTAVIGLLNTVREEHIDFTYNFELFMIWPEHREIVMKSIATPVLNNVYYKTVKEINGEKDL